MRAIFRYFRQHRWQRRAMTGLLAVAVGAAAAILLYPTVRDRLLIRDLTSDSFATRDRAAKQLRFLAARRPETLARLNRALSTDSDRRFAAIAAVLRSLDAFHTPDRSGLWLDRLNAIELAAAADTAPDDTWARRQIMAELLLDGRDNRYVRRALGAAATDKAPTVRQLAAMLAARLADDKTLVAMLDDADPGVAASAAIAIGAAGRNELGRAVLAILAESKGRDRLSAAAWACAQLLPKEAAERVAKMAVSTPDAALRDRLLYVLTQMPGEHAAGAVGHILSRAKSEGGFPPAMALLAAGRLKLAGAAPRVLDVLALRDPDDRLTEGHLLAALQAAELLEMLVRRQADAICRRLWGKDHPLLLVAAAGVLGRQLDVRQPPGGPSREHCVETLRLAAGYMAPASQPASARDEYITTPLPSAAAAVALWRAGGDADDKLIRRAAGSETTLEGDYIAFHASRGPAAERAFALGLKMLPPSPAPLGKRVFNDNERAAGAMLLALSARTDEQKRAAADRIAQRLDATGDFFEAGALRCALLILGRRSQRDELRQLLANMAFPHRRVITALCAAGDPHALDWLLFNKHISAEDIAALLTTRQVAEVLSATAPQLPRVDAAAGEDLQLWQVRIMRHYWAVRRTSIRLGLQP